MKMTKKQLIQEIRKIVKEQNADEKTLDKMLEELIDANPEAFNKAEDLIEQAEKFADKNKVPISIYSSVMDTTFNYVPNYGWVTESVLGDPISTFDDLPT